MGDANLTPAEIAGRPTYTRAQIEEYFNLISLPESKRRYTLTTTAAAPSAADADGQTPPDDDDLAYLTTLIHHQILRIPFENLTLHYSWHKVIDPRPQHMFNKIVRASRFTEQNTAPSSSELVPGEIEDDGSRVPVGGGRGGYCMEVNSFFHTVLLSIGFDVYLAGGRVWTPEKKYTGFSHCVNIVTIKGVRYLVDVAFGSNVSIKPLPLVLKEGGRDALGKRGDLNFGGSVDGGGIVGVSETIGHIEPGRARVLRAPLRQGLNRGKDTNLGWIYQVRYNGEDGDDEDEGKWLTQYMFVDQEFFLEDIDVANLSPGTSKKSFFTHMLLAVRFTSELEEGPRGELEGEVDGKVPGRCSTKAVQEGRIDGALILWGNTFKWRRNGVTVIERKIEGDQDRLQILRKYFGIEFDEDDVHGIKGTAGALGGL